MVDYRLKLKDYQQEDILKRYKKHVPAYGGLFTPITRQNLLRENPKLFKDTPNLWSDIRKSVKNGIIDMQFICSIASSDQKRKMFEHTLDYPNQGKGGEVPKEFHYSLSTNMSSAIRSILYTNEKFDEKNDQWKIELARKIIKECLGFYMDNHLIRSPVHQRHLSEVDDILAAESR